MVTRIRKPRDDFELSKFTDDSEVKVVIQNDLASISSANPLPVYLVSGGTSVTYNVEDPLTLVGTTIGITQANATTDGYLSSTDYATFKANTGTNDHSGLSNLTFASSGHIGFAGSAGVADNTAFRTTPSSVITAGTNIAWDGNTLNVTVSSAAGTSVHSELSNLTYASAGHIGFTSSAAFEAHTGSAGIHFLEGSISHANITDIGSNAHTVIDTHIASSSIHFTKESIELGDLSNVVATTSAGYLLTYNGTTSVWEGQISPADSDTTYNATAPLDITGTTISISVSSLTTNGYVASADFKTFFDNVNTTYSATSPLVLTGTAFSIPVANTSTNGYISSADWDSFNNKVSYSGTASDIIDAHIASSAIHFTEASISHANIADIGTNAHTVIDTHLASSTIHYAQSAISIPASQVSDFDTEVSNNTDVAAVVASAHAQGTDTALGTMTQDINMNNSYQIVGLQAPAASGEAIRQTTKITEAKMEAADDHVNNNTQAHSDYLLNSGSDSTSGTLTAAGFTTTGVTVTGDHGTNTTDQVVNVCYGTGTTAPTANTTTIGALYIQYTA